MKKKKKNTKPTIFPIPKMICRECAHLNGGKVQEGIGITWHMTTCPVCKQKAEVAILESFGYPKITKFA